MNSERRETAAAIEGVWSASMEHTTVEPARALFQGVQCAFIAAAIWCLVYYFGEEVSYGGDDSSVLIPLFDGGLAQSMQRYIRPLEYLAALLSLSARFPVWLVVSFLTYVLTSVLTLTLLRSARGTRMQPLWMIVVCASSPLMAQVHFQIDTVSQSLANLFSLAFTIACFACLRATDPVRIRRHGWTMVVLALMCVLSKETSYGVVVLGSALVLAYHRQTTVIQVACMFALLGSAVLWTLAHQYDLVTTDAQYGIKPNPLYFLFSLVFSAAVAIGPAPTSIVLTGGFLGQPVLVMLVAAGCLTACAGLIMFMSTLVAIRPTRLLAWHPIQPLSTYRFLVLFLVFSIVPSMFMKAAELYASQMVPAAKVLLLMMTPVRSRISPTGFWLTCSALWVVASSVNTMYYGVATGFDPNDSQTTALKHWIYAPVLEAATREESVYSVYSAGMYQQELSDIVVSGRNCRISSRHPDICLPKNIGSGFPYRI